MKQLIASTWSRTVRRRPATEEARADTESRESVSCGVCGEPATGWSIRAHFVEGVQVIDGAPVCRRHERKDATAVG